jgi:hypothetical protein
MRVQGEIAEPQAGTFRASAGDAEGVSREQPVNLSGKRTCTGRISGELSAVTAVAAATSATASGTPMGKLGAKARRQLSGTKDRAKSTAWTTSAFCSFYLFWLFLPGVGTINSIKLSIPK